MPYKIPPRIPRTVIPGDVLDRMIADYSPLCPVSVLVTRAREGYYQSPAYSVHIIRRSLTDRGVRILGQAEIMQGQVDAVLDPTDAADRYKAGEDATGLAREFGVNPESFRKWLGRRGIPLRDRQAALKIRFRDMNQEERLACTAAMRSRRAPITPELTALMAKGREGKPGPNWTPAHRALTEAIRQAGYRVTMNKAAGPCNMPVATDQVGFDVTMHGPDWTLRNRPDRIRYFLGDGLDVVTLCTSSLKFGLKPATMTHVLAWLQWRGENPRAEPVYATVTRDGEMLPVRTLADIPAVPPMTARKARERASLLRQERREANKEDGMPPAGSSSH